VPQRLRQQVKRKLYLTCHPRSRIARLSAVARLATASAVHILLGNYVIQNQNIAQLCTCRNACDSE
jgi:hypothetical protein